MWYLQTWFSVQLTVDLDDPQELLQPKLFYSFVFSYVNKIFFYINYIINIYKYNYILYNKYVCAGFCLHVKVGGMGYVQEIIATALVDTIRKQNMEAE